MFSWFHATVEKPGFRGISTFLVLFLTGQWHLINFNAVAGHSAMLAALLYFYIFSYNFKVLLQTISEQGV